MAFIIGTILCMFFVSYPRTTTVVAIALVWWVYTGGREETRQVNAVTITASFAPSRCDYYEPMLVRFHNGSDRVVKEIDAFYIRGVQPGRTKPDYGTTYGTLPDPGMSKMLAPGESWQTCVKLPSPYTAEMVPIADVEWQAGIGTMSDERRNDGRHITFMTPEEAEKFM